MISILYGGFYIMKKAEHSFLTLTICVVAAMFIGLTVLACGKTTMHAAFRR